MTRVDFGKAFLAEWNIPAPRQCTTAAAVATDSDHIRQAITRRQAQH